MKKRYSERSSTAQRRCWRQRHPRHAPHSVVTGRFIGDARQIGHGRCQLPTVRAPQLTSDATDVTEATESRRKHSTAAVGPRTSSASTALPPAGSGGGDGGGGGGGGV